LKLAPILAQYLYSNKRLDLPGIGSFTLDSSANPESIAFTSNAAVREEPDLVDYISTHTGKMKALAAADLDSYLQLALQFLNIGKPFLVEGIGSLVKIKSGQFAFAPGEIMPDKMKEYSARELSSTSSMEESFGRDTSSPPMNWKKPLVVVLILAGIAMAIWGGYTVYQRSKNKNNQVTATEEQPEQQTIIVDSNLVNTQDSNKTQIPAGSFKFIVEVAPRDRIFQRLSTLQSWGLTVKTEPVDSINYKLYFILPASPADTARIRDSLSALYTPAWTRGYVEQ
jgi:hypothetical protein